MTVWFRRLLRILLCAILMLATTSIYVLYYYPLTGKQYVFTALNVPEGQFVVVGQCSGPFEGWYMSLLWKRSGEYWARYYVAHDEPYWTDASISDNGGVIVIKNDSQVVAKLNTQTMLNHLSHGNDDRKPIAVYTGDPLSSDAGEVIEFESPQWASAWPHKKK